MDRGHCLSADLYLSIVTAAKTHFLILVCHSPDPSHTRLGSLLPRSFRN
jgi:hypothetical protein